MYCAVANTLRAIPPTSSLNRELTTSTHHPKTPTTHTPSTNSISSNTHSTTNTAPPILLQAKRVIVVSWVL
jgi:hypothetical protein